MRHHWCQQQHLCSYHTGRDAAPMDEIYVTWVGDEHADNHDYDDNTDDEHDDNNHNLSARACNARVNSRRPSRYQSVLPFQRG